MEQTYPYSENRMPTAFKTALSFIAPPYPWWFLSIQAAIAAVIGLYASLPAAQQWVLIAVGADLLTGAACGIYTRGGLRARTITQGITKKAFAFGVVVLAHKIQWTVPAADVNADLGTIVASWYLIAEAVSIAENLDELGVPLPPIMKSMLAKARAAAEKQ